MSMIVTSRRPPEPLVEDRYHSLGLFYQPCARASNRGIASGEGVDAIAASVLQLAAGTFPSLWEGWGERPVFRPCRQDGFRWRSITRTRQREATLPARLARRSAALAGTEPARRARRRGAGLHADQPRLRQPRQRRGRTCARSRSSGSSRSPRTLLLLTGEFDLSVGFGRRARRRQRRTADERRPRPGGARRRAGDPHRSRRRPDQRPAGRGTARCRR